MYVAIHIQGTDAFYNIETLKYDWLCHLATFCYEKGGQLTKPIIHAINFCMSFKELKIFLIK